MPTIRSFDLDLHRARDAWLSEAADDIERRQRQNSSFLAKRDVAGRTVDFHSLRTTFGTNLAKAGVSPQMAQRAMRHSDMRTTLNHYTLRLWS